MKASTTSNKSLYGSIAMIVALLLGWLNVEVAAAEIEQWIGQGVEAVQVLLGIGGALMAIYGQWKQNANKPKS